MADGEKEGQQDGVGAGGEPEGEDGLGDDLFDLFTEEDTVNEHLALLTASLEDVDIHDLLEQVRELQDIMNERQ